MSTHVDETDRLARLAGKMPSMSDLRSDTVSTYRPPTAPAYVYLLAENLDAVLAAGEDLLETHFTWNAANPRNDSDTRRERTALRDTMRMVRSLELSLIARTLRAREHAEYLARKESSFRPVAQLFASGITPLVDAVDELSDATYGKFETGAALTAYLRSRAIIDADAAAPIDGSTVFIPDHFLVAERVPLSGLMDLVAMFLDTLETRYDLFDYDATERNAVAQRPVAASVGYDDGAPNAANEVAALLAALNAEPAPTMSLDEAIQKVAAIAGIGDETSSRSPRRRRPTRSIGLNPRQTIRRH